MLKKFLKNTFIVFLFFNQFAIAQVPFQIFESATMEEVAYVTPVTSYHFDVNLFSSSSLTLMEGDMYVNLDGITGLSTNTHQDSACTTVLNTPGFRYNYVVDTVCSRGVDWSEIRFKDCTGAGCYYYDNPEFPLKFTNTTPVSYVDNRVKCFLRQQFALNLTDLDTATEGYIEFVFKVGSYELTPGSLADFDNIIYSEYPITISINGGTCSSSSEEENIGINELNEDHVFISYQEDYIMIDIMDQIDGDINAKLINLEGKIVKETKSNNCEFSIPCSDMAKGMYLLQLSEKESNILINKKVYVN